MDEKRVKRNEKRRKKAAALSNLRKQYVDKIDMLEAELRRVKLQRQMWIDKFSGLE